MVSFQIMSALCNKLKTCRIALDFSVPRVGCLTKMGDSDSGIGVPNSSSKFYQFGAGTGIGINFFPILESESESE